MGCRNLKGLETLWLRQEIELNSEPPHDFVAGPGTVVSMGDPGKDWRAPGDQLAGPQHRSAAVLISAGSHQPWEAENTLSWLWAVPCPRG